MAYFTVQNYGQHPRIVVRRQNVGLAVSVEIGRSDEHSRLCHRQRTANCECSVTISMRKEAPFVRKVGEPNPRWYYSDQQILPPVAFQIRAREIR